MRRYDTFTPKAKKAFFYTVESAEEKGKYHFVCNTQIYYLRCKECPFDGECPLREEHLAGSYGKHDKTASEWLAWAGEEIEEGN